jgi:C4-dicarboxylate-binding protein DctP
MRLGAFVAAFLVIVLAVVGVRWATSGGARTGGSDAIVLKFSYVTTNDTPKGKAALKFKALAEAKTGGRVKVELYPNSILYKDKEELEALQMGAVQMLAPSLAKFSPLGLKEFEVFDLPYVLADEAAVRKVTLGPVGKGLLARLEKQGLVGLAYWDNGFKVMTANRPLRDPADFRGLKMRIQSSKVLEAQMRHLKVMPQVMAFSESYQALQTGVVDGTENSPSNIYTQKMHEVQSHLTLSNHGYIGYAVIVNKKFWDGLPADVRAQLADAMAEATEYGNAIAQAENAAALEAIRKAGHTEITVPTPAEQAEWRAALMPVHAEMARRIGPELLQQVYAATGRAPALAAAGSAQ